MKETTGGPSFQVSVPYTYIFSQVTQQSKYEDLYGKNGYILKPKKYEGGRN